MRRKSLKDKILDYLSSPRPGQWTKASQLARYLKEPLEQVEFCICRLTDDGLVCGICDEATDEYWLLNLWQKDEWEEE